MTHRTHSPAKRRLFGLVAAAVFLPAAAPADPLRDGFADPPPSARPRVWWHWMYGNVTVDGIDKELA